MSADTSFADLLNRTVGSSERPKPLPVGSWQCVVKSREFGRTKSEKQTPYVRFVYGIVSPGGDVDPSLLAGQEVAGKEIRDDFYITPDSVYRLEEFLMNVLGLTGMSTSQAIDAAIGRPLVVHTEQEIDKRDQTKIYTRVKSYSQLV